jgi:hypothetical protein
MTSALEFVGKRDEEESFYPIDLMNDYADLREKEIIDQIKICWNLDDVKQLINRLENKNKL